MNTITKIQREVRRTEFEISGAVDGIEFSCGTLYVKQVYERSHEEISNKYSEWELYATDCYSKVFGCSKLFNAITAKSTYSVDFVAIAKDTEPQSTMSFKAVCLSSNADMRSDSSPVFDFEFQSIGMFKIEKAEIEDKNN